MKVDSIYPYFQSTDKFKVGDHLVFVTKLDRETKDFSHIIGQEVVIDNDIYVGKGVERYAHCPPWRRGESIAISVYNTPLHSDK